MKKTTLKKIWNWFQVIALIYFVMGTILYFFQDLLIFHPKKLPATYQYKFSVPFNQVDLAINDKKNLSIVQFYTGDTVRKGIVLYFHGNRGNINRYAKHAVNFTRNGYDVWMMDYPGYGKSTGKRNEAILYEDALTFYKMAISQVPAEQIVVYGKSLGTGIASQLASIRDCRKLILETPYYSLEKLATHYFFMYPAMALSKYEIPSYQYFQNIKSPITIFHGKKDRVIPYKHALWLKEKKPGTELVTIEKGRHNNLPEFDLFREKLDSLLSN